MSFDLTQILSVSLILFSIIDIIGNIPIIIDLKKKSGQIHSAKATIVAGLIMIIFLFLGDKILGLFGIDVGSFSMAGALIMFLIGMEMVLGIELFKSDPEETSSSIVPIAFPLIAGPGTMTSLISLRAEYNLTNILVAIFINLLLIYGVLRSSSWLERMIGQAGFNVIRKVFGIILLAISIKLFKNGLAIW